MDARDTYRHAPPPPPRSLSRRSLLRLGFTAQARADIDYDGVTARVRAGWEVAGEPLLRALEPVAEAAAVLAAVGERDRVLDAAAGDGNVALACLRRGAVVDACDLVEAMVGRGRARCGEGVRWTRADVQSLPYPDGAFDVVVSCFGAALAPRARATAHELARVLRPDGRLVLAAWVPRGLPGGLDTHVALPDGVRPPSAWADAETARRRLEPLFERLERRSRTVALAFATPGDMFDALTLPLGLDTARRAALRPAFDGLLGAQNNCPPAAEVDARYVLHAGRRRG